jgi:hypothetical protein
MTRASRIVVVTTLVVVALVAFFPPRAAPIPDEQRQLGYAVRERGVLFPDPPVIDSGRLLAEVILVLAIGGIVLALTYGRATPSTEANPPSEIKS